MQPPTDNLYKFLAIFGLVLIGFSGYVVLQRLDALGRENVLVDVAYQPMFEQQQILYQAAEAQLSCSIGVATKREAGKTVDFHVCDYSSETGKAVAVAKAQLAKLETKATALVSQRNYLFQQYRLYSVIAVILGCLGVAACVLGFWFWYDKLQRYEDAALRAKAVLPAARVEDDSG